MITDKCSRSHNEENLLNQNEPADQKVQNWIKNVKVYPDSPESLHVNTFEGGDDDASSLSNLS